MSLLEKNLGVLERRNPELARRLLGCKVPAHVQILEARTGDKVPSVAGRSLHSAYNPQEEARRIVASQPDSEADCTLVLGFGFAYHVEELLRCGTSRIRAVERDPGILRAAMEARDLTAVLAGIDLDCRPNPDTLLTFPDVHEALRRNRLRILTHEPSGRVAPGYYEALRRQLSRGVPNDASGPLRVLIVSPLFGGSWSIARYAHSGFAQVGCDAELLDMSPFRQALQHIEESLRQTTVQTHMTGVFHHLLCEFAYWKIRQLRPELVLFLAQAPASIELLDRLRSESFRTAFWFVENYRLFTYWKEIAPHCDHFFAIQRGEFCERLDEIGAFNHHYLPLACDPEVHRPLELTPAERVRYGSDVSFAGLGYYNRLHVAQGLADFDLKLWGPGWDRAPALAPFIQDGGCEFDCETMLRIYNASAINLNLHSSTAVTGIEPDGDFVNPRTFELAGCSAFQLTDPRSELRELFELEREVVTFGSLAELRRRIRHFLDHPGERRAIAARSRERALLEHTYARRMRQMLERIYPAGWVAARTGSRIERDQVRQMLHETEEGHDLRSFLESLPPDSTVSIKDLIADMARTGSHPGRAEVTLRWMDEIVRRGRRR